MEESAGYRPASTRARWATVLLIAWIVSAVLMAGADGTRISVANGFLTGASASLSDAQSSDDLVRLATWTHLAAYVLVAIAFLMWLHRVVANSWALGAHNLRFTPGWAVGWWFVPIANWVRPFQVVSEAWRAADSDDALSTAASRGGHRLPAFLWMWWILYLLGSLIGSAGIVAGSTANSITALRSRAEVDVASLAVGLVAALLAVTVVQRLSKRQEAKALVVAGRVQA